MSRAEVDEGRRNDMNRRQSLCVGCSGEVVISGFCCRPSSRVDVCVCGAESCWMSKKIDVIWGESAWGGCFIASGASRWCTIGSKYDPHRPSWIPIHTFATIQSSWMIAMYAYLPITAYSTCSELLAWFFFFVIYGVRFLYVIDVVCWPDIQLCSCFAPYLNVF